MLSRIAGKQNCVNVGWAPVAVISLFGSGPSRPLLDIIGVSRAVSSRIDSGYQKGCFSLSVITYRRLLSTDMIGAFLLREGSQCGIPIGVVSPLFLSVELHCIPKCLGEPKKTIQGAKIITVALIKYFKTEKKECLCEVRT